MRHARSGGTERYLDQLAAFLAGAGHEVTILCRRHVEAPHPLVRFEVLRPIAVGGAWRMWSFALAVEEFVSARRGDFDLVVGLGKTWSHDVMRLGGGVQRTYLELAHRATREGPEKLIARFDLKQRFACAIEERALRPGAARKWICNSAMVRRDVLARFALPEADVVVVHNGVDPERFHPRLRASEGAELRRALGLLPDELVVLFLGTGYGRKGLRRALEGFALAQRAGARARLLVVGYDSALERYRSLAGELGVAERCLFLGGRGDAPACFAASDLYVLPTLYDPFANSTLEALASGLPVLTSDTNGAAELLTPGREGEVSAQGETDAQFAERLARWLDRERVEAARPHARALAEANSDALAMRRTWSVLEQAAAVAQGASGA